MPRGIRRVGSSPAVTLLRPHLSPSLRGCLVWEANNCPVCRTSMSQFAKPFGHPLAAENTHHCRVGRLSSDDTVEAASGDTPSWIMVNYRLSLHDQCCLQRKPLKVLTFAFTHVGFRMKMEELSLRLIDLSGSRKYVQLDVREKKWAAHIFMQWTYHKSGENACVSNAITRRSRSKLPLLIICTQGAHLNLCMNREIFKFWLFNEAFWQEQGKAM